MARVLYFGCIDQPGHYLVEGRKSVHRLQRDIPWTDAELDMTLCPGTKKVSYGHSADRKDQIEGHAKLTHRDGWTALAFWDRSVDHRYNSNSVFIIEGQHDAISAIAESHDAYPWLWERFKFNVKIVEGP
jgi:hypothetical protein